MSTMFTGGAQTLFKENPMHEFLRIRLTDALNEVLREIAPDIEVGKIDVDVTRHHETMHDELRILIRSKPVYYYYKEKDDGDHKQYYW